MKDAQNVKIFCSYAHEDLLFAHQLKIRFDQLYPSIFFWTDTEICAGEEWEQTIQEHLNTAQIILLLISPDFMNSDYCYHKEMIRAMERHETKEAHVIPILIRFVADWEKAAFAKLQILPIGGKPITDRYWDTPDEAILHVVKKIFQVIGKVNSNSLALHSLPPPSAPNTSSGFQTVSDVSLETETLLPQTPSGQLYAVIPQISEIQLKNISLSLDNHTHINKTGIKTFGHHEDAYHFLVDMVEHYSAKKAVFIQYSGQTSIFALRKLLRIGAEVEMFIQHEDTAAKMGSQFQADRIIRTTRTLRTDLGNSLPEPDKLKVFKYRTPCSMSAIKIDNRLLYMGWYTYEQKEPAGQEDYPDDTMELSGHDRAAVVVWQGNDDLLSKETNHFQALCATFNMQELYCRKYSEFVSI